MSLAVRVLGVGDAFTTRYFNASLVVECDGTRLLVDAPPALARALAALGPRGGDPLGLDDVDHVVITHLHGDHVGGLEQLLFWRRFVTRRRCTVYATAEVLAGLWDGRLRGGMDRLLGADGVTRPMTLADYADVVPLGDGATRVGALALAWRPTIHHVPTAALRISGGGRCFGYSADTAFDPTLIAWLAAADLFFHETNLGVHTPLAALLGVAAPVRARMRLIHYPDALEPDEAPIACAREGERHEL